MRSMKARGRRRRLGTRRMAVIGLIVVASPDRCFSFDVPFHLAPARRIRGSSPSASSCCVSPGYGQSRLRKRTKLRAFPELASLLPDGIPFEQLGRDLEQALNIGEARVPEAATSMVLASIGRDLLVFLLASVVVTPVARAVGITPILGYLLAGALLGPHGMDVFSNTEADVELGDFGILFLLFSEGLEVSRSRLAKLANYLPLGFAQISLCTAALTAGILLANPYAFERFVPLASGLIDVRNPVEALVLALAGTLSTSAFVFPVLKEREWEEEDSGQAATSILLLQDLFVAPLLVLMPYIVGQGLTDYAAIGFLTAKATLGFGSVVYLGSFLLSRLFRLVAQTNSTETFVALSLLVSVGMGAIAKTFGLTDTAGAFAAGVLLANTNYRSQIQADILPFKGILLGIFFMGAGSSFDTELVVREWPTIIAGSMSLIVIKAVTLAMATRVPRQFEPNRLSISEGIRVALLLAGGGEFAFVVLAAAEKLEVLPRELGGLLTAIILITMSVTPLLGELAALVSAPFIEPKLKLEDVEGVAVEMKKTAYNAIIVCGCGEIGSALLNALSERSGRASGSLPPIVVFESDPARCDVKPMPGVVVLYGNPANPEVIRASGVTRPTAIFVTYEDHDLALSATSRLHISFQDTPIYTRAQTRSEAQSLQAAGATEVIVESDELPRSAPVLLRSALAVPHSRSTSTPVLPDRLRQAAATAANLSLGEVDGLLQIFKCVDQNSTGLITADELLDIVSKSNAGLPNDEEVQGMDIWLHQVVPTRMDAVEFCRMYARAPAPIKEGLRDACSY